MRDKLYLQLLSNIPTWLIVCVTRTEIPSCPLPQHSIPSLTLLLSWGTG